VKTQKQNKKSKTPNSLKSAKGESHKKKEKSMHG